MSSVFVEFQEVLQKDDFNSKRKTVLTVRFKLSLSTNTALEWYVIIMNKT